MKRLVAASLASVLSVAALAQVAEPAGLGAGIRAAADEAPAFVLSANGVHVYQCKASPSDASRASWYFTAPDATLFEGSRSVATHKTVNLWESLSDRSSVSGVVRSTQPAGTNNLPWARYRAQPMSSTGMFAGVTSILRANTSGGAAPTDGCTTANLGAETRVAFSADYYFYRRRAG
ncbi:MAG TPA: DUF3455 domain-containing protein [Usitatibacter sp.]|nr:DUF3455 domain-containing protein [Usitatibacter sp.]